ncbi:MAG: UDP-N-acetylmuramoyl-L-alanine--D-glutamate ligase [Desulfovibrionaceae bacterium]|nr:UDP-N-acetylmuramoyl-L-alanine--D-glutamate ligase [Desulfovibrionaceae bacterium]
MPSNIRGQRPKAGDLAVVLGAGRSGKAAVKLLAREGCQVRLLESNPLALSPEDQAYFQDLKVEVRIKDFESKDFLNARWVIPSPGIPKSKVEDFLDLNLVNTGQTELIAEMELAYRYLKGEPILAVTGTSGKTTTVSVAAAMLQQQGYSVFLGGNIGTPLSEYVLDGRKVDVLVLEISSFQLQTCSTFAPRVAVLLNLSPNHLDYHKDMQEYASAKYRLFRWQDANDLAVLGSDLLEFTKNFNVQAQKVFIKASDRFPETKLLGQHNRFNLEAAWQACRFFGVSLEKAKQAVAKFNPLPHRLEKVREHKSVLYVNDSKCTTVSALSVALKAFERPIRLLCGGKFKGGDLEALSPLIKAKVVEIALFGASREIFEKAYSKVVPTTWYPTLKPAVEALASSSKAQDVVLLAPATASFDLYKNYQERGQDFRSIVEALN